MNKISDLILRPNRETYTEKDLGPKLFFLKSKVYKRTDLQLKNSRNLVLQCSHFEPSENNKKPIPCIIYCHGNSGSRMDCFEPVDQILTRDFSVFVFDFSGSGLSEGTFVSLGYWEQHDIRTVVDYLRQNERVSSIALWGRSMGAVSSLLYAASDNSIVKCIVLDSPFSNLEKIILEIVQKIKFVPNFLGNYVYKKAREQILQRVNFDIAEIDPIKAAELCKLPAMFIHGTADKLVEISHSHELMLHYKGDKALIEIKDSNHNSSRPE